MQFSSDCFQRSLEGVRQACRNKVPVFERIGAGRKSSRLAGGICDRICTRIGTSPKKRRIGEISLPTLFEIESHAQRDRLDALIKIRPGAFYVMRKRDARGDRD